MQMDALREVANIGCGHAVSALGRLMGGRRVSLSVPRAMVVEVSEVPGLLGGGEAPAVAASLGVQGDLRGLLLLVLPLPDAVTLELLLLRREDAAPEERESALSETANIVASACLSAIGTLTGLRLLPTVPALARGPVREVLAGAVVGVEGQASRVVVLETHFSALGAPEVSGQMLLVLEREGLQTLLARLGL
jgi:chemotaxis protein CheC